MLPIPELINLDEKLKTLRDNRAVQESKGVSSQQSLDEWKKDLEHETDPERKEWLECEIEKAENQLEAVHEGIQIFYGKMRLQVTVIPKALKGNPR